MKRFLKTGLALAFAGMGFAHAATELVIATVNNGHMIEMQKLTPFFEKANPDIKLKWVTLEEGTLRQRVTTDIATKGGQFDVMTIGLYEGTPGYLQCLASSCDTFCLINAATGLCAWDSWRLFSGICAAAAARSCGRWSWC